MANFVFQEGMAEVLGTGNILTDDIRALLVRNSGGGGGPYYTTPASSDQFLSDIPSNADCRPATAVALGTKTVTNGKVDAANTNFGVIATGDTIHAVVIYRHTGVESTSPLLFYIDGLAISPDGSTVELNWHDSNGVINFAP